MSTKDVADGLMKMWNGGQWKEAGEAYWAEDAVSCEPMDGPMARIKGKDALRGKAEWWDKSHEEHSFKADGLCINGDQFLVHFAIDVTNREDGKRMQMSEHGLYTIKDGKIVEERFFMPG